MEKKKDYFKNGKQQMGCAGNEGERGRAKETNESGLKHRAESGTLRQTSAHSHKAVMRAQRTHYHTYATMAHHTLPYCTLQPPFFSNLSFTPYDTMDCILSHLLYVSPLRACTKL